MDFSEALKELKSGSKIRRGTWDNDMYLYINENNDLYSYIKCASLYNFNISILLSNDWSIDVNGLNSIGHPFDEAIKALNTGKKVKLSTWTDQYLELDPIMRQIVMRYYTQHLYTPGLEDFSSEDWSVVE